MSTKEVDPLSGRVVALPENRELDALAGMLERRGAVAVRCPLVAILDNPDQASVAAWIQKLIDGKFDDLILLTGEGLRRLTAAADRLGIRDPFIAALARVRKITRGPKPVRALKEIGLNADLTAAAPTSAGVIETLTASPLKGRCVGVQLYGLDPNAPLIEFLAKAGAAVQTVSPYVYAPAIDAQKVASLLERLSEGRIDAIAFTSASQVDRLFEVAFDLGRADSLTASLAKVRVAAVGPVVRANLASRGVRVDVEPTDHYFMAPLVTSLAESFAASQEKQPPSTSGRG